MDEVWKPIPGFEADYEISNLGNIKRISPDRMGRKTNLGKIIKPMTGARGYLIYSLFKDGKPHSKLIHRLVMEAFVGPRGTNTTNHKNGVKTDNRLENLEYVSHSANYRHALDVLGFKPPSGSKHHMAKISDDDVLEICRRLELGEKHLALSREFGITSGSIYLYEQRKSRARNIPRGLSSGLIE